MTHENKKNRILAEIQKGDEALQAGEQLVAIGLFNDAVARMYYAAFHYAQAALASVNVQARSHRALQSLFSLHLVKPGHLPFARSKELRRLQGFREAADYDAEFRFDEEGAREELTATRNFTDEVRDYLRAGNWM